MPCFDAKASARLRSRAATASIVASLTLRAGLIAAAGAMRAAPRMPIRTGFIGRTVRSARERPQRGGGARRMALGPGDLVLCSGTLAREASFRERVDAAVAGGFSALSLWGRDYGRARREGFDDADMRALLADHGLTVAELDLAWWWLPGASEVHIPAPLDTEELFAYDEAQLFGIADALGARSLNAIDVFGGDWTVDAAATRFAGLCDRAAEHGLLVHIEFLPWSRIPNVAAAWEIVRLADRPNGGLLVDAWHFFRSGAEPSSLGVVPVDRVLGIQL